MKEGRKEGRKLGRKEGRKVGRKEGRKEGAASSPVVTKEATMDLRICANGRSGIQSISDISFVIFGNNFRGVK